ncbi:hypothetical protein [Pelagivirga sediminicola]|nr:hypothetical protein [Pelagivirga sediminicola]
MIETDPVASNLKRAYRDAEPQKMPSEMERLLRQLQQMDEAED